LGKLSNPVEQKKIHKGGGGKKRVRRGGGSEKPHAPGYYGRWGAKKKVVSSPKTRVTEQKIASGKEGTGVVLNGWGCRPGTASGEPVLTKKATAPQAPCFETRVSRRPKSQGGGGGSGPFGAKKSHATPTKVW